MLSKRYESTEVDRKTWLHVPSGLSGPDSRKVKKSYGKFGKTGLNNWNISKAPKAGRNQVSGRQIYSSLSTFSLHTSITLHINYPS